MNTSKIIRITVVFVCIFITKAWAGNKEFYGKKICHRAGYTCLEVRPKESWESLWPDVEMRDAVMRINRRNMKLHPGITLAVPSSLAISVRVGRRGQISPLGYSPFVSEDLRGKGVKLMVFDPRLLAWAAYDQTGKLVRWGPASGGSDWCDDIKRICHTPIGTFKIEQKYGSEKRSDLFPIGCHGTNCAPIPYFMKFKWSGAGFHGSLYVPGFNDSHGCVRLFLEDAEWLNKEFTEIGTVVVVSPY